MTMKKIILLSTAAMLLSPVAAKAGQKGSILVGLTGTLERLMSASHTASTSDSVKNYDGENYLSAGAEAFYTYKVYNNLQVAGGVRGMYALEHEFETSKNHPKLLSGFVIEPRVTVGYEFEVAPKFTLTPYAGLGFEFNIAKEKDTAGKEAWASHFKLIAPVGVRVAYDYFYANLNARFDVTSTDLPKGNLAEAPTARNFGVEVSIGAEF
jgi:hypothetical protein